MARKVLFFCPDMAAMAKNIADKANKKKRRIELAEITWGAFADGWPRLFIRDIKKHRRCKAYFLASFSMPGDIFAQLGIIYALARYEVKSLTIVLPFFSTGTMERVDNEGEVATAMTLARMLDAIPGGGPGFGNARIVIYDIHALSERFFFHSVVPRLETAIPLLLKKLEKLKKAGEKIAIGFPDDGALKRFGKHFPDYPKVICGKVRNGDKRIVTIKEGDPNGYHIVIIDDLILSGGTLLECGKALRKAGAKKVSAYATHGVFPEDSWRKFLHGKKEELFDNIWITDSCSHMAKLLDGQGPFQVLSLAKLIKKMILTDGKCKSTSAGKKGKKNHA